MVNKIKFIISITICQLAGIVGSVFIATSVTSWYINLTKPDFTPPSWIFAPMWIILYFLKDDPNTFSYLFQKSDFAVTGELISRVPNTNSHSHSHDMNTSQMRASKNLIVYSHSYDNIRSDIIHRNKSREIIVTLVTDLMQ